MRMLVDISLPLDPFNGMVKNGTAAPTLERILDDIKPEAAYFSERGGKRGGILIVDVADPSRVPAIAEPFFLTFNASVEFRIVMSPEDLANAGLNELGKRYG
jgi:hypothetical protein